MKKLIINPDIIRGIWITFSAIFLLIISPYNFPFINIPNNFMGFPIPGSPVFFFLGLLIPILFVFLSAYMRKKGYIYFFFGLVSTLALLEAYWIINLWNGGIKYLGESVTKKVAIGNTVCFLFVYILTWVCYKWRNFYLLSLAAIALCLTLTFVAFPWFGEYM